MPALWVVWLIAVAVSFSALEGVALASHRMTLSRFVWRLSRAWPPLPFVAGLVAGGLAAHFWWIGQGCDFITGGQ